MRAYGFLTSKTFVIFFIFWNFATLVMFYRFIEDTRYDSPDDPTNATKYADNLEDSKTFAEDKHSEVVSLLKELLLVLRRVARTVDEISNSTAQTRKSNLHNLQENRNFVKVGDNIVSRESLVEQQEKSREVHIIMNKFISILFFSVGKWHFL